MKAYLGSHTIQSNSQPHDIQRYFISLWNVIHRLVAFIHIGGLQHCLSYTHPPMCRPPPSLPHRMWERGESSPLQTTTQHGSLEDKIGIEINKC